MNKLYCIMIESPAQPLPVLENYLETSASMLLSKKFFNVREAADYCRSNPVDMVFCNINSVEKETIDEIKCLQPASMIVCAGTRDVIERKNFEENIFAYLYKPFSYEKMLSLETMAYNYCGHTTIKNASRNSFVFVKSEYKTIRVDLDDILYCEGLKDYTQIYLQGKIKPLVTLQNLKSLSEKLPAFDFIRVHRSFIVSMKKIDSIARNEIRIGQAEIPIGDAYREKLNAMIDSNS